MPRPCRGGSLRAPFRLLGDELDDAPQPRRCRSGKSRTGRRSSRNRRLGGLRGSTMRGGPISSSSISLGSRPAAWASSATKDWTAKPCGMFDTERNQPMRVWASASPFSQRRLGMSNGTSTNPCRAHPAARASGRGQRSPGWSARRCDAARRPPCPARRARHRCVRRRRCGGSRAGDRPRASRSTLTGAPPISLDSTAASSTKSHFDLRPKPPPSNVTWTVTSSAFRPSFLASSSRVLPGLCTRGPGLAFAVGDAHGRARRLHRRMREVRDVILRRNVFGGRRQRLLGVAVVAHDLARPARGLLELRLEGGRIVAGVRAVIPGGSSASRPLIAAQVLRAMTATPPSG